MPEIGEIKRGKEIGKAGTFEYIWSACSDCGKERWVPFLKGITTNLFCQKCKFKGARNPAWKGGRIPSKAGYITVRLSPDDFFFPMANKECYVFEHRLVVAKAIGRCLHSWEIVHHKGTKYPQNSREDKADNRYPENLQLVTDDRHKQITILESKIDKLLEGQRELKAEIRLLRLENNQLRRVM